MLSYFELNELLTSAEAEICAAECHGFLCGQICVYGYPYEELWQEFIDAQTDDIEVRRDCYREITVLLDDIIKNIQLVIPRGLATGTHYINMKGWQ